MFGIIMAGGRGTRFWPLSRKANPKQLLNIVGDSTMLQMTVDRLKKMKNVEEFFIITGSDMGPKIKKMIKGETCDFDTSSLSKREWNELMESFGFKEKVI